MPEDVMPEDVMVEDVMPVEDPQGSVSEEFLREWDAAYEAYDDARKAGLPPPLTEFLANVPTEVRPHVRKEIEADADPGSIPAKAPVGSPDVRYRPLRELGQGGFGRVFLAWDCELQRQVAVKVRKVSRTPDPFQPVEEARNLASVSHPGIAHVHDVVTVGDDTWIISEFVEGQSLAARLQRGALPEPEALTIARGLLEALAHAHDRGVIHRDVKPSNVILDPLGRPHLVDFGLAIVCHADFGMAGGQNLSRAASLGTPGYRPPEFERLDASHADARSDLYSVGVVLFEMLTGRRAFPKGLRQPLPAVRGASPKLLEVCRTATAEFPADRFPTTADFLHALGTPPASAAAVAKARPAGSRRQFLGAALGVCVVGAVVTPIVAFRPARPAAPPVDTFITCSDPGAEIAFAPLDEELRPRFEKAIWTRPGTVVPLLPGDYLVTAIGKDNFIEVLRRVPESRQQKGQVLRQLTWRWKDARTVELPPLKLVRVTDDLLSIAPAAGPAFLVQRHLATMGDAARAFGGPASEWSNPKPYLPINYDQAVQYAESVGLRVPMPLELTQAQRVAPVAAALDVLNLWTSRSTGEKDSQGRETMRLWPIHTPPAHDLNVEDLSQTIRASRSGRPARTGVRLVRSAAPRAAR